MQNPTAIRASLEDYDRSIASLVAAFIRDPFIRGLGQAIRMFRTGTCLPLVSSRSARERGTAPRCWHVVSKPAIVIT